MATKNQPESGRPAPRLYLLTPPVEDAATFVTALEQALAAADIAAVLLRLAPGDEAERISRIERLAPLCARAGAALVLDGHADLVGRCAADGAHLTGIHAIEGGLERLKPRHIAGAGGLTTRHDAMLAAEGGADYVLFGEPDLNGQRPSLTAIEDRISWWAEVFEPPCVGYAAAFDEVTALARAGADFVAVADFVWNDARGTAAAVADAAERLKQTEVAK
jgi:thiamine-phosphate pyrophosphorylase